MPDLPTELICLTDTYKFADNGNLLEQRVLADGRIALVLDRTVFYPQGGGQPADAGVISSSSGKFEVTDVRSIDGAILHLGKFIAGQFHIGESVQGEIDRERRLKNAKLHSAGHLIDVAVQNLGYVLKPGKAYHFSDGPYVEYEGEIALAEKDAVQRNLEIESNLLMDQNLPVHVLSTDAKEAAALCGGLPEYIDQSAPVRVVSIDDYMGCPCAGTHVASLGEIGPITISKVRTKAGKTRVSYLLQ
jgi:Ser-tRNA(Ala) deacylase AlaX